MTLPSALDELLNANCVAAWGESVSYGQAGWPVIAIQAVVDDSFKRLEEGEGAAQVIVRAPAISVRLSDFPAGQAPSQRDSVTVRGRDYAVSGVEPDGFGMARLTLVLDAR